MNKLFFKKIAWMMIFITLSGCSEMNAKFDCPMKPGVSCESLDQVNARVDQDELGKNINAHAAESFFKDRSAMSIWIAPYVDQEGNHHAGHYIDAKRKEMRRD